MPKIAGSTPIPCKTGSCSSAVPHDAHAEGSIPVESSSPKSSRVKTNVLKDALAESTPNPHTSPVIVPDGVSAEDTVHVSVPSKPNGVFYNSLPDNAYSVPKKPIFSPMAKSANSHVHTGNSFSILDKEIAKTEFFPQKRARKQTKKALESKAQGTKGLWEVSSHA